MTIEKAWLVKFKDVNVGQVFEYNGTICIRIFAITSLTVYGKSEELCNAIDLSNGKIHVFEGNEEVTVYNNAKVVVI